MTARPEGFDARYNGIVDTKKLAACKIAVVGAGTIGRPLTLMLAEMGADNLTVFDADTVSPQNMGNQGWPKWSASDFDDGHPTEFTDNMGKRKTEVLYNECMAAGCEIDGKPQRVTSDTDFSGYDVVFYGVDSVLSRKNIAEAAERAGVKLHVDGRIAGQKCQIVCGIGTAKPIVESLPETDSEAPCGQKATRYIGNMCASLMVSQFVQWLKGGTPSNVYQNLESNSGKWGYIQ